MDTTGTQPWAQESIGEGTGCESSAVENASSGPSPGSR